MSRRREVHLSGRIVNEDMGCCGFSADLKEVSTSHDLLADWYLHDDLEVMS